MNRPISATMHRFAKYCEGARVLEVGPGDGTHTPFLRQFAKHVITVGPEHGTDIRCRFESCKPMKVDGVWASHVLEHVVDPGAFLRHARDWLSPRGVFGVVVPAYRPALVGGHVTAWTPGILFYQLVLAGFDLSRAFYRNDNGEIGVLVRNAVLVPRDGSSTWEPPLVNKGGDLEALSDRFPTAVSQYCNGWFPGFETDGEFTE